MNERLKENKQLEILISRYPQLAVCKEDIQHVFNILVESYEKGGKLLIAGNGGSAADAEHIVGELMKAFINPRTLDDAYKRALMDIDSEKGQVLAKHLQAALPAIALDGHVALTTAYQNDCEPLLCFAQQVNGYGAMGDVFLGISTSGNSANIIYAAITAKAKGLKVFGLTGNKASQLSALSDVCIRVPETETYKIQELHLPIYHALCLMLEDHFFGNEN